MDVAFYLRWARMLTLCKLGFHYFGWCRNTVDYHDLPQDGLEYDVCGACYAANPKPNGNKAQGKQRLRLYERKKK